MDTNADSTPKRSLRSLSHDSLRACGKTITGFRRCIPPASVARSGILVWLLLVSGWTLAGSSTDLLPVDDWSLEAAEAQRVGRPILILFTGEYCSYCERLKAEVLKPMAERGELGNLAHIRELDIARGGKIRDFDGEKVRTKAFVKRYGIYATPTLVLVDNRGEPLAEPIVGFNNLEDYMPHLEGIIGAVSATPQLVGSRNEPSRGPESS